MYKTLPLINILHFIILPRLVLFYFIFSSNLNTLICTCGLVIKEFSVRTLAETSTTLIKLCHQFPQHLKPNSVQPCSVRTALIHILFNSSLYRHDYTELAKSSYTVIFIYYKLYTVHLLLTHLVYSVIRVVHTKPKKEVRF
jgi:hypothetical protein